MRSRGSSGGWFAWWWVWLVIIICAIWFAGWGWGGYGGWWWGNRTAYPTRYDNGANPAGRAAAGGSGVAGTSVSSMNMINGPGVAILSATDKTNYIGKPFEVTDAVVTKKVNDHAIWVGANSSNGTNASMLVVLAGTSNNTANDNLGLGDRVDVTGTVDKAPAGNRAQNEWGLGGNGQKQLQQEGAYVSATQVRRAMNGAGMNGAGTTGGAAGTPPPAGGGPAR